MIEDNYYVWCPDHGDGQEDAKEFGGPYFNSQDAAAQWGEYYLSSGHWEGENEIVVCVKDYKGDILKHTVVFESVISVEADKGVAPAEEGE